MDSQDSIACSGAHSSRSRDQLLAFNWSQAKVYVFQSYGSPLKLIMDFWIYYGSGLKSIDWGKFKMP